MKAIQINKYGGNEVLQLEEVSVPTAGKGQVQVKVAAASINPFDIAVRSGMLQKMIPLSLPITVGGDMAGTVVEVGDGVDGLKKNDEVYGTAIILSGGSGGFAEYASANSTHIAHKPKNITFIEAASLVLVGVSAVQAIEEHMSLKRGQKILIHGGAGGIGSIAIQLAKHIGAYVITTVRSTDAAFVKSLGADAVIDYQTQKFETMLGGLDAVYDTIGADVTHKSIQVLKKSGILVSMKGQPDSDECQKYGVNGIGQNTKTNTLHLTRLAELVENGFIKPKVDKVFALPDVQNAYQHLESGHPNGKVVLKI